MGMLLYPKMWIISGGHCWCTSKSTHHFVPKLSLVVFYFVPGLWIFLLHHDALPVARRREKHGDDNPSPDANDLIQMIPIATLHFKRPAHINWLYPQKKKTMPESPGPVQVESSLRIHLHARQELLQSTFTLLRVGCSTGCYQIQSIHSCAYFLQIVFPKGSYWKKTSS